MKYHLYSYGLIVVVLRAYCIKLSFIDSLNRYKGFHGEYKFQHPKISEIKRNSILNAVSRTGVCVPEDVALYGRTIVSYECLYTKDGRTQTGDEWEAEMTAETKANFPGTMRKMKKPKKVEIDPNDPDQGFERLEFPAPFNPTKMLLREGIPYLRISCWAPGIKKEEIKVFINYSRGQEYPGSFQESGDEVPNSQELNEYYETCESEPVEKQHKYSYHSTYNDVFNLMEKAEYGYADTTEEIQKPPLILINFPKNTVVNQWERVTFSSKRDPENQKQLSRIQRAYRPFTHIDLRNISCVYKDGTLQLLLKLTHITPPLEFQKNYTLPVSEDGEIKAPKILPLETVHGWMYNWHYFPKYDLNFDLSKFDLPEPTEENKPKFVDDMTPRQVCKFIREVDEMNRKNKD